MPAYLIVETAIHDDSWLPGYTSRVHIIAEKHGGRYLSRTSNIEVGEGERGDVSAMVILEFPNTDAAKAFHADPDYAEISAARRAGSTSKFTVIDDQDVAGVIPYLPSGAAAS